MIEYFFVTVFRGIFLVCHAQHYTTRMQNIATTHLKHELGLKSSSVLSLTHVSFLG
jgi:hypothetical protein